MRESGAETAAVEVKNVSILAAGEDHAPVEGIVALGVHEADALQQLQGVALAQEMTPQVAAGGIADPQFLDESRIMHPALFEIPPRLRVTVELPLIENSGVLQHVGRVGGSDFLFEVSKTLAEGEMPR
jgi:hypothetical protein